MADLRKRHNKEEEGNIAGGKVNIDDEGYVTKKILVDGQEGTRPPLGSVVSVHYVGTLLNGMQFDSSVDTGPLSFTLGNNEVIRGWELGVATMNIGEKMILNCAPEYAYGGQAMDPIPAYSTLVFEMELLSWRKKSPYEDAIVMLPVFVMLLLLSLVIFYVCRSDPIDSNTFMEM